MALNEKPHELGRNQDSRFFGVSGLLLNCALPPSG